MNWRRLAAALCTGALGCAAMAGCGSSGSSTTAGTGAGTTSQPAMTGTSGPGARTVAGVPCQAIEQLRSHYHAHLTLLRDGTPVTVPAQIGISVERQCIYWLHTHAPDGVIHIESPDSRRFTLGQFFAIWGQPLSRSTAGPLSGTHVFVDGRPYSGDPAGIVLRPQQLLTIESGRQVAPPPYTFPAGL